MLSLQRLLFLVEKRADRKRSALSSTDCYFRESIACFSLPAIPWIFCVGTAQTAISIRAEAGHSPGIACATYPDGPTLRAQVQQQAAKFDDIIIDAGGRDSTALRAALVLSDVLIVPFQPRSYDVWALNDIAALVDEARSVRDNLRAVAVLNCADPGEHSTDNTEAAAAVGALAGAEAAEAGARGCCGDGVFEAAELVEIDNALRLHLGL